MWYSWSDQDDTSVTGRGLEGGTIEFLRLIQSQAAWDNCRSPVQGTNEQRPKEEEGGAGAT